MNFKVSLNAVLRCLFCQLFIKLVKSKSLRFTESAQNTVYNDSLN